MNTQTPSTLRRFLGNRAAVVTAGTVGFLLGASGFVAAQNGADDASRVTTEVETTIDDNTIDDNTIDDNGIDNPATHDVNDDNGIDNPATHDVNDDDSTSTSLPGDDDDDSTSTSLPGDNDDDSTSTSLPGDDDDDSTSTSLPGDNDDDSTSTSVPVALPDAFTETYQSAGGTISVSWSGTAFSINSISPAAGFEAEIEDNAWNRVRVDFESAEGNSGEGHNDSRIEVRLSEGRIRVNIS